MVVYEIKDIKSMPTVSKVKLRRREVKPVEPSEGIQPIDIFNLSANWSGEPGEGWKNREGLERADVEKSTSTLIRMINEQLASLNILMHLTLFKDEVGYFLDVYDCSDGRSCRKVAELPVELNELPELLKRLRQQAGILVDKSM